VVRFECDTRIWRVIHGRDALATSPKPHYYPTAQFSFRCLQGSVIIALVSTPGEI